VTYESLRKAGCTRLAPLLASGARKSSPSLDAGHLELPWRADPPDVAPTSRVPKWKPH